MFLVVVYIFSHGVLINDITHGSVVEMWWCAMLTIGFDRCLFLAHTRRNGFNPFIDEQS